MVMPGNWVVEGVAVRADRTFTLHNVGPAVLMLSDGRTVDAGVTVSIMESTTFWTDGSTASVTVTE